MDKVSAIKLSALSILDGRIDNAKNIINKEYPFKKIIPEGRNYTDKEKYEQECKSFERTMDSFKKIQWRKTC